jgi:catechol 2,3-dioxygenase
LRRKLIMNSNYTIPPHTRIGHVHLKVADIKRSLDFYCELLGFELITMYGSDAAFISAGGYHHHIGLNVWYSKGAPPAPRQQPGLFHTAILYPSRSDLAQIFSRLRDAAYPFTGASDHGVSEACILTIPTETESNFIGTDHGNYGQKKKMGQLKCLPNHSTSLICFAK